MRDLSLEEDLVELYKRRLAVENLIHSLEEYDRCYAVSAIATVGHHRLMDKWTGLLAS